MTEQQQDRYDTRVATIAAELADLPEDAQVAALWRSVKLYIELRTVKDPNPLELATIAGIKAVLGAYARLHHTGLDDTFAERFLAVAETVARQGGESIGMRNPEDLMRLVPPIAGLN